MELTAASAYLIPVDKVNVCEFTAVKNAVLDGHGLASAEEYRAEVPVGVHARKVAGLVNVSAELRMDWSGVTVLVLLAEIGNELAHDVKQIVLKVFEVKAVDVVRALLYHDRAGGVVRGDAYGTVLYTGLLNDLADLL